MYGTSDLGWVVIPGEDQLEDEDGPSGSGVVTVVGSPTHNAGLSCPGPELWRSRPRDRRRQCWRVSGAVLVAVRVMVERCAVVERSGLLCLLS
jgi:hypothetical protein